MKARIILNPYANRWRAKEKAPAIEAACQQVGLDYDLYVLPAAGMGKEAAISAVEEGYDVVVAAGGDGTVNETLNGLISVSENGSTVPFGVIPVGTGNDFNDMNGLPRQITESVNVIANGKCKQIDAGHVSWDGQDHYFGNNCALAMEPLVTIENNHITRLKGNSRYAAALIKALAKLEPWDLSVTWDDGSVEGPMFLLSVCNSPRTGGIFPMAPGAETDDGLLDFVAIPEVSKIMVLNLLTKLVRGTHIHHEKVSFMRSTKLKVSSQPGTPIHADGEVITEEAHEIDFEVIPSMISLISQ